MHFAAFQTILDARYTESPHTHPNTGFLNDLIRWERHLGLTPEEGDSLTFEEYVSSVDGTLVWDGRNRGCGVCSGKEKNPIPSTCTQGPVDWR